MSPHSPIPLQLERRLKQRFGVSVFKKILEAYQHPRSPTLRINTLKTDDPSVMKTLRDSNIKFERVKTIPHALVIKNQSNTTFLKHTLVQEGQVYLQGISSMIPPLVLDPQPGETVLDLCAAPGSKTSQMAAMMKNIGKIIACEKNELRFQKLTHTLEKQGVKNTIILHEDATLVHRTLTNCADRILADVPCSAEGRIDFANPRTYKFWSEKNIRMHARLQRRLLRSAVLCLKPGGRLVYSTCTLAPEENEDMVAWLLQTFLELQSQPIDSSIPNQHQTSHGGITILPSKLQDGFFVALFKKRETRKWK